MYCQFIKFVGWLLFVFSSIISERIHHALDQHEHVLAKVAKQVNSLDKQDEVNQLYNSVNQQPYPLDQLDDVDLVDQQAHALLSPSKLDEQAHAMGQQDKVDEKVDAMDERVCALAAQVNTSDARASGFRGRA